MQLSTNDLRFLAEVVLNKVDFEPKDYNLDNEYLSDLRDLLLQMVEGLETKGEFDIVIEEVKAPGNCEKCENPESERVVHNEGGVY